MSEFTPEDLLEEERALQLDHFDYEFAWRLGSLIRWRAMAEKLPIAIEVTHGADPVFYAMLPGATSDNTVWVARKRNVAVRFQHSTLYMRKLCELNGSNFNQRYRLPESDYAAAAGSVPLLLRHGGLIGTVSVSGLPGLKDHTIITDAIAELIKADG